jgi:hypothetical protein
MERSNEKLGILKSNLEYLSVVDSAKYNLKYLDILRLPSAFVYAHKTFNITKIIQQSISY